MTRKYLLRSLAYLPFSMPMFAEKRVANKKHFIVMITHASMSHGPVIDLIEKYKDHPEYELSVLRCLKPMGQCCQECGGDGEVIKVFSLDNLPAVEVSKVESMIADNMEEFKRLESSHKQTIMFWRKKLLDKTY